jgi:hypothetical protein
MTDQMLQSFLFIIAGISALLVGMKWKKLTYGGALVHKYGLIVLGLM